MSKDLPKIDLEAIRAEAEAMFRPIGIREHERVLQDILDHLEKVDFRELAELKPDQTVPQKIQIVVTVQEVLAKARDLNCGLCKNGDFVFAFNGEYWRLIEKPELESFLGEAAERIGVDGITARYHRLKKELLNQFFADAHLPQPVRNGDHVLINLANGTYVINNGRCELRSFRADDFLTYQLPFEYDPDSECPQWEKFLAEVLPDRSLQAVLAEFIGYVFARHLKLEKTLILYGSGANGKSVVFDVINAMLGPDNVSNVSLESISKDQYYRAMLANKLLNYSSEISNRLQAEKFKQLTSGEPIEARLPFGQPMILRNYARLAFNSNDLPKDVEHSDAFFRRFLIIPFSVTIPERKRNPELSKQIIATELSGVFNWVLAGLHNLLKQNGFSHCAATEQMLNSFRRESDSVAMFLVDEHYRRSETQRMTAKDIFGEYRTYCADNGYRSLGRNNFMKRLETNGIPREDSYQTFFRLERVEP